MTREEAKKRADELLEFWEYGEHIKFNDKAKDGLINQLWRAENVRQMCEAMEQLNQMER